VDFPLNIFIHSYVLGGKIAARKLGKEPADLCLALKRKWLCDNGVLAFNVQ